MRRILGFVGVLVFLFPAIIYSNLLTNGDFEQPLTTGWLQEHSGTVTIDRAIGYDTDGNYEACANKDHVSGFEDGYARLYQVVDVSITNVTFSCDAKCEGYESTNYSKNWAAGAIIISYLNASNSTLGETRIYSCSPDCPWVNSATVHLITASNANWNNYSFNINDELTNLSGVDPLNVAKIKISLYSAVTHDY